MSSASSPARRRAWTSSSSPWDSTSVQNGGSTFVKRAATAKCELPPAAERGGALLGGFGSRRSLPAPPDEGEDAEHHHDEQEAVEPRRVADPAERDRDQLDDGEADHDHEDDRQDHEQDAGDPARQTRA